MSNSATMPFPVRLKTHLKLDPVLLLIVGVLLGGGLVILTSASITVSDNAAGQPFFYVQRQLVAALIGLLAAFSCLLVPMRVWQTLSPLMVLAGLALLVVVLVPGLGYEVNGATRWVRIGIMNLQVSEPARLCLLIYLAGYVVRQQKALRERFVGFLRPMLVLTVSCVLLLQQPDFGAAIVLLATALVMLFVGGARIRDFVLFFSLTLAAMTAVALTSAYRLKRLTGFLDPWADPYDSGFQLTQSLIAVGRGEWFGVGLGDSVQKLFYLPEAHTDFVFAVYAEEFGLLGSLLLIGLFLALLWRVFQLALRAAASGALLRVIPVDWHRYLVGLAGLYQHRRQHGNTPDQGLDPAADQLRSQQPHCHDGCHRHVAAHSP